MTLRRDPNSLKGALYESCQRLGWGHAAQELGVPESRLRTWADPHKEAPPSALVRLDKALKASGHPPLNSIAFNFQIGNGSNDVEGLLTRSGQMLDRAVLEVEGAEQLDLRYYTRLFGLGATLMSKMSQLINHVSLHQARKLDERDEAQQRPTTLRSVI